MSPANPVFVSVGQDVVVRYNGVDGIMCVVKDVSRMPHILGVQVYNTPDPSFVLGSSLDVSTKHGDCCGWDYQPTAPIMPPMPMATPMPSQMPDIGEYLRSRLKMDTTWVEPLGATCIGKRCPSPYNEYAEPNLPDGSFMCYSCRGAGFR